MNPVHDPNDDVPEVIYSEYESEPVIKEILGVFTNNLPSMLNEMHLAMQGGDEESLESLAHQLKGAAGGYGYPMLTAVAAKLEQAARDGDWEIATLYVARLDALCAAVLRGRNAEAGGQS